MVDITVFRNDGTHPGEDIVDGLISTVHVALSRGRAELDAGSLSTEVTITTTIMDVQCVQLLRIDDGFDVWVGKCTAISHRISSDESGNIDAQSTITLSRPRLIYESH